MRFLAANDLNNSDPMPPLGEKVERAATPARTPGLQKTGTKGVFQGSDGKFFTAIPENEMASAGSSGRVIGGPPAAPPLNGNSAVSKWFGLKPGDRVVLLPKAREVCIPLESANGKTVHTVVELLQRKNTSHPLVIVIKDANGKSSWHAYPEHVRLAPAVATCSSLKEILEHLEGSMIDNSFPCYAPRP